MKTIETQRLILRSWTISDVHDLYEYAVLPTVGPNAGWNPHQSLTESLSIVQKFIKDDDVWAIVERKSQKVIGSVGLHNRIDLQGNISWEIGYVLSTLYEGQGLMTEAVKAVISFAFSDCQIDTLYVKHFIGNDKSRRVIEKCGFIFQKTGISKLHNGDEKESMIYCITKKDYLKQGGTIMYEWDLKKLYQGFEDLAFLEDLKLMDELIKNINETAEQAFQDYNQKATKLTNFLQTDIRFTTLATKLFTFCQLNQATNSTNIQANKYANTLSMKFTELTKTNTVFQKWVASYPELDADIAENPFLKEHEFYLHEIVTNAKYMLDEKTEMLVSKLKQTGSSSWHRLQALLTSTLAVNYEGKKITLSQVRNLAYDSDGEVRKKAYYAEIDSYKQVEKAVCFALNGIKGEVNTLSELRGYASPLDEALIKSRMKRETLDTMIDVCKSYLPVFRAYLKRKGELLGHRNGLPFYDLFAPMGKNATTFTIPQAKDYILKNFRTFNERLYLMAKKAFEEQWIDFTPREGKVGGAFCDNIHPLKESRVLTNFTGMFGDVITISHELGHAYHGECIFDNTILNADYTMPVAETASTFCETIVNKAALRDAVSNDERISLLESSIQDYTQVIVDILSRFIFESNVFTGRKSTIYDENELKNMMIDAQKQTYGDGLDPDFMHPYMWLNKSHYYSGGLSFYNFPYAFGLLFAKGLYAQYLKEPQAFVAKYDLVLQATGCSTVEDTAKMAGIDVTKKAFWIGSLELIKQDIDLFIELTK
ncbi:MAG: M3 family oligoendopeptidase [Candidatus Izemoplasmatales bacterium]|jgi:pepF/M3 family oligoendopeptidase|nr:M3 family oligoendopeptidase [Candidatus Izemoplasmatales bacterium]MDD3865270.1 M3 family oligoendopeptidase [Candidatus Izemoplasmatales bacterium]